MKKFSKKSPRKPARPRGKPPQKKQALRVDPELVSKRMREALLLAEVNGVLRPFITGAARAFRNLEKKAAGKYDSPTARHLRLGRESVTLHLASILRELDTQTKVEIIRALLFDLWVKGSQDAEAKAHAAKVKLEWDETAAWGILAIMRHTAWLYCKMITEGDETLVSELPVHATELVQTLDHIARKHPHLVKAFASETVEWPIMAARHYPKKSDFKELADRIGLASKSPIKPKEGHTWKPTTSLNRYLLTMIVEERWGEGRELTKQSIPYYLDEVLMPLFESVANEEGGWENYEEFAVIARSAAKRGKGGVQKSEIRSRVKKALKALASDG